MPKNLLFLATPLDPDTGLPVTVRMSAASATDSSVVVNGYQWKPCVTTAPNSSVNISPDGYMPEYEISWGNLEFRCHTDLGNISWQNLSWDGADASLYFGEFGATWANYTKVFDGKCGQISRDGQLASIPLLGREAQLNRDILTATYAGTDNAEGPATLAGVLKPRAYGECKNIEAVLIDPVYWIYQYHGYGATEDVVMVYENAYQVNATSSGTYATYAALKAATLVAGQWAKAPAVGMFRLGGEPSGKITADIKGAKIGGTYSSRIKDIIPDLIETVAGVSDSYTDETSFNSFDNTTPFNWCLYQTEQESVGEIVRDALHQCGGYLFSSRDGIFKVGNFFSYESATALKANRTATPLVRNYKQLPANPPVYQVKVGYDRCWSTHSDSEISAALFNAGAAADAADAAATAAMAAVSAAQADADDALAEIAAISNDNILHVSEKPAEIGRVQDIANEYATIESRANGLGITTTKTAYTTAYNALNTYLATLTSPVLWSNLTDDTTIVGTTYRSKFNDYYTARKNVLDQIYLKASEAANWTNVTGKPTSLADLDAAAATAIADAADDDKLTRNEKSSKLIPQYNDLRSRYELIKSRADVIGTSTTTAASWHANVQALLADYSPAWNDTTQNTTIYTHWFSSASFPTGWTTSNTSTSSSGIYTVVTDASAAFGSISRSKAQTGSNQYSAGIVVKKDSTSNRYGNLRISGAGGTVGYVEIGFRSDIQSTVAGASGGWTIQYSGQLDLGEEWFVYITGTCHSTNTSVAVEFFPAIGPDFATGFVATTTGSMSVLPPRIVAGDWKKLGRYMLNGCINEFIRAIEDLNNATGDAYGTSTGTNELTNTDFSSAYWTLPNATRTARNGNLGFAIGNSTYCAEWICSTTTQQKAQSNGRMTPVTGNKTYYASIDVQKTSAVVSGQTWSFGIDWYNSAGTFIGTVIAYSGTGADLTAGAIPKLFNFPVTSPSAATGAVFWFLVSAHGSANGRMRFERPVLTQMEPFADVTSIIDGVTTSEFRYNYTGVAEAGQFPRDLQYKLMNGLGYVSSGITWTYTVKTGTVNGFTSASGVKSMSGTGVGTFTVSSLGADISTVEIKAVNGSTTRTLTVTLTKKIADAPVGGGGGGGSTTILSMNSGFTSFSTTTFTDVTGSQAATQPAGVTTATVTFNLSADPGAGSPNGSWSCEAKVQVFIGGAWTDKLTVATGGSSRQSLTDPPELVVDSASLYKTGQVTGLTGGTAYSWRLVARVASGGTRVHTNTGSWTIVTP